MHCYLFLLRFNSRTLFFIPMSFTSLTIHSCRIEGIWNRTLLSGVKISDIILANFIFSIIFSIVQTVQFLISIYFELNFAITKDYWVLALITFALTNLGFILGFLMSTCVDDFHVVFGTGIMMCWFMTNLSGFCW